MTKCKFNLKGLSCPNGRKCRIENIPTKIGEKIAQSVLCIFNGKNISKEEALQNPKANKSFCNLKKAANSKFGMNCSEFVTYILKNYNILNNITGDDYQNFRFNENIVLRKITNFNELYSLQYGSALFLVYADPTKGLDTLVSSKYVTTSALNRNQIKALHVLFYLGIPDKETVPYVGGCNHTLLIHDGVVPVTEIFNFSDNLVKYNSTVGNAYHMLAWEFK